MAYQNPREVETVLVVAAVKYWLNTSYQEPETLTVEKAISETTEETTRMDPTMLNSNQKCLYGGMGMKLGGRAFAFHAQGPKFDP